MTKNNKITYIGKEKIVGIITKKPKECRNGGWAKLANNPDKGMVNVERGEMDSIYSSVLLFRQGAERSGKETLEYYLPALNEIESAYMIRDYVGFVRGLDKLLGFIGMDD